jgi:hypothetical protein
MFKKKKFNLNIQKPIQIKLYKIGSDQIENFLFIIQNGTEL